ncbi:MAG TPA: OsmC family protein [Chitinophagales bacterium]|nr:OsmC family protein [Chitinophagales bacterium]
MKRSATANWKGSGEEGKGLLSSQSTVLNSAQYSFGTRFENGVGTNPEELIAAAHAGCFTMKLSFALAEAGFKSENIDTKCDITFENGAVTESHLTVKATVPGIDADKFKEVAADAAANCPISKLLSCKISHEASLA